MYFVLVIVALISLYFVLPLFYALFFNQQLPSFSQLTLRSISIIVVASLLIIAVIVNIPEPFSNRIQHAVLGGFMAFLVCFLAVKDSALSINKFQFFTLSAFVVTTLGVGNEIMEFIVQEYLPIIHFVFAATITDTWLDLVSNTVGILIAALCFVPLYKSKA